MIAPDTILAGCFWASASAVVYAYAGYPLAIHALSRAFGIHAAAPEVADSALPRVALLIIAHNEAAMIEARIKNAIALDYPRDRLAIVIASDGSDDATCEICRRYSEQIRLLDFPNRRGKADTLTAAIEQIDAEIVVFSDANTFMDTDAVRRLAAWFSNPSVGVVSGRLVLTDPETGRNVDSIYWRYETFLKQCEGRLGALLGANGAIYAIRRSLFRPLPVGTVVDDFVIPLSAKLRSGCKILFDTDAIAREETPAGISDEFRRRSRIGVGGFHALSILWPLLSPKHGWTAFAFWSHKVMRWVCPFLLIAALLSSVALVEQPLYRFALAVQIVFYAMCVAGMLLPAGTELSRVLRVFTMFTGMNVALMAGFFRWISGGRSGLWNRTERAA